MAAVPGVVPTCFDQVAPKCSAAGSYYAIIVAIIVIGLSFSEFTAGSCLAGIAIGWSSSANIVIDSCSATIFGFAAGIVDSCLVTAGCFTD